MVSKHVCLNPKKYVQCLIYNVSFPLFKHFYEESIALTGVAQWIEHGSANQSVGGSYSQSGHMPGLQVRSTAGGI